jgi:DMSO/TMAO reductase YedYZ heme-binding membrane subunit
MKWNPWGEVYNPLSALTAMVSAVVFGLLVCGSIEYVRRKVNKKRKELHQKEDDSS